MQIISGIVPHVVLKGTSFHFYSNIKYTLLYLMGNYNIKKNDTERNI